MRSLSSDITYRVMCNQGVRRISHPAETEINSCVVYSPESFPIFWEICQKNNNVQHIAAVASDIASAAYTPVTPIKCGNINASGINSIALRNKAMKIEIRACPNATNIFWQARCNPKIVIPPKNTGIVQRTGFNQSFVTRKRGSYR